MFHTCGQKSKKLGAKITPKDYNSSILMKRSHEGIFYRFTSPLNFIKKICKKADKMSAAVETEKAKKEALNQLV